MNGMDRQTNRQTDGQTDRQGQILMSPDYRHGGRISVKINSSSIKKPHAYIQYVHNKYAWFQNDPLKIIRAVDYTSSIPYNAKSCLK